MDQSRHGKTGAKNLLLNLPSSVKVIQCKILFAGLVYRSRILTLQRDGSGRHFGDLVRHRMLSPRRIVDFANVDCAFVECGRFRTGYWKSGGVSVRPHVQAARAAALKIGVCGVMKAAVDVGGAFSAETVLRNRYTPIISCISVIDICKSLRVLVVVGCLFVSCTISCLRSNCAVCKVRVDFLYVLWIVLVETVGHLSLVWDFPMEVPVIVLVAEDLAESLYGPGSNARIISPYA